MENRLENKQKFIAQYWGQVIMWDFRDEIPCRDRIVPLSICDISASSYLELTPLSMISDEDAIEVGYLISGQVRGNHSINIKMKMIGFHYAKWQDETFESLIWNTIEVIDYLRSKGYALPFMGLSVDKQIEYGWIKLKN